MPVIDNTNPWYTRALAETAAAQGNVAITDDYDDTSSHQPVAADLNVAAGAGTSDQGDTAFIAAMMGNVLGEDLTKTHNYLGGVVGAYSVTGTKATEMQTGAVVGIVMDGVTEADGAVVAVLDGSDPSAQTNATAAFAARGNNNHADSGFDYGLDLYDAGRSSEVLTDGLPLKIVKADIRTASQAVIMTSAGAPSNGTTGDGFAGTGSLYIDTTNGVLYINTGAIDNPTWVLVGDQTAG